jgi:hypothetical protein
MRVKIFIAILLMVFISLFQEAAAQKWTPINQKEYSIKAPSDWSVDVSKQMGTDLVIFSMLENSYDKFRENVNVMIQNIAGKNINLEKYTAISLNQVKTMAADGKIEESKTVKTGNSNYQKIIYTATQAGLKLKFEQYYFIANNKAYVVTLTTEANKFELFRPEGEEILNSFLLK